MKAVIAERVNAIRFLLFYSKFTFPTFDNQIKLSFSADELRKEGEKIHERTETVDSTWNPISTNNTVYLLGNSRSR